MSARLADQLTCTTPGATVLLVMTILPGNARARHMCTWRSKCAITTKGLIVAGTPGTGGKSGTGDSGAGDAGGGPTYAILVYASLKA